MIAKYQKSLELKGEAKKGKGIFKESCASCHKLEGVGETVGPDLASITDYVVGLPRSIRDHETNSIVFGPDGALYVAQ